MKILHTEWMRGIGGQAKRVLKELEAIREFGYEPLLAAPPKSWIANEAQKRGIKTYEIDFKGALDVKSALKMLKIVKNEDIHIIHSHSSKESYAALFAAKAAGKKFVRSRHMDLTKRAGLVYRMADAIITTGSKIKKELINQGVKTPIYSIPSYPDRGEFFPSGELREKTRRSLGLKGVTVGALTGLKRDKRPHLLIQALKGEDVEVAVAGVSRDENYRQEFEKGAKGFGGYVGYMEPNAFLNAIDIYACPSKKEGVPQSVMQAMMVGLPVVSMDVGGISDLNVDGNLLLAKDFGEFKEHLQRVVRDPQLAKRLGEKNRQLALRYFNEEVLKRELKRVYESL